jgi:predicted amidohydrolase
MLPTPGLSKHSTGPTLTAMAAAAQAHSVYVVVPQAIIEDGKRRNSSILLDRSGAVVGIYHKNVPPHSELDMGIIPGTETPVFETDFSRLGLAICFDINYWEIGHALCTYRPDLAVWSSMWMGVRMMSRWAIEFGFYIAGVFSGDGAFIDPARATALKPTAPDQRSDRHGTIAERFARPRSAGDAPRLQYQSLTGVIR